MDKNNEQKSIKTPENKQKQDGMKPWLKLLPAAAVFAAVCVTCYQADKAPVESIQVADNNLMSALMVSLPFLVYQVCLVLLISIHY